MKDLIDYEGMWDWLRRKWAVSFGWMLIAIIAFVFGMAWENKQITDDCKFMNMFRDGTQAYSCQLVSRLR